LKSFLLAYTFYSVEEFFSTWYYIHRFVDGWILRNEIFYNILIVCSNCYSTISSSLQTPFGCWMVLEAIFLSY
jgi:hypothetical protein